MTYPNRPAATAVLHILTTPSIADRCAPHVTAEGVDWYGLFGEAQTMSGGEQLLVQIASDLEAREGNVSLWELSERLARPTFDRVLEALELSRGDEEVRDARVLRRAA